MYSAVDGTGPSRSSTFSHQRMNSRPWIPLFLGSLLVLRTLLPVVQAIKFDLQAERNPEWKCIWNFANDHTLIIVTANAPAAPHQRIDIDIMDGSEKGNVYLSKRNINGETRLAVTTHGAADIGVCLRNVLDAGAPGHAHTRTIDLDIDIGSDAVDYNAIQNKESLSALEVEMRKLEDMLKEIVDELGYLQKREMRMRDTNESTNSRVQNFAFLTFFVLVALGVWQILHLRAFFKRKYLID